MSNHCFPTWSPFSSLAATPEGCSLVARLPREKTQDLKRWLSGQGLTTQMTEFCLKPRTCYYHPHSLSWEGTESLAKPASVSRVRNASTEGSDKPSEKEERGPALSAEKGGEAQGVAGTVGCSPHTGEALGLIHNTAQTGCCAVYPESRHSGGEGREIRNSRLSLAICQA